MRRLLSLIACLTLGVTMLMAQNTKTVSGRVISSEDGEPVISATVSIPGSNTGTVTDIDGRFSFSVPQNTRTLKVSFIGMTSVEVAAGTNLTITLEPDAEVIDEVVVTAYGTSTKGTFTGSATTIKSEKLQDVQVTNVTQALTGTAGVQVQSSNGQPGVSSTIRVRGVGSINAGTSPLYIVDGVPFDGDLSSINTADIESMTVLKDAASTALYGARGANGIIMVTTKKGKSGKSVVNFDAKYGYTQRQLKGYDTFTSPKTYLETQYQAIYNAGINYFGYDAATANAYANTEMVKQGGFGTGYQIYTVPAGQKLIGTNGMLNPYATLGYVNEAGYYITPDNWSDETFRTGTHQSYDISVSGGSDMESHYVSLGYLTNDGIIEGSGFERLSTRMKADYKVKNWLKIGGQMAYANSTSNYPGEQTSTSSSGNGFLGAYFASPIYPIYVRNADGSIKMTDGKKTYDYGQLTDAGYNRQFMGMMNAPGDLAFNKTAYRMDILNAQGYWQIEPYRDLTVRGTYGMDLDNTRYDDLGNPYMGNAAGYGGTATQEHMRTRGFTQQYLATYTHTWDEKHAFDATLGYEGYTYLYNYIYGYNTKLYNPDSYFLSNSSGVPSVSGGQTEYATKGFFGRVNYTYDEKYIVNASVRRDASSRFAKDKRWGTFWSGSAAWLVSAEDFMKDLDWVNMLKVKASYGQSGNDAIGNYYAYLDQYSVSGADGVWSDGTLSYKGNPDLTWETSVSYNLGVDFSLFNSKLNGTVEYFGRKSKDMLYYKPVASSNGYSQIAMNVGSMTNSGVEIDLSYDILRNKNYSLNVHANATYISNTINELHPDLEGELIDGSYIYREGQSRYHMYIVEYAGVNQNDGVALYRAKNIGETQLTDAYGETVEPGQEYVTENWSTAYSTNRKSTKNLMPKWYGGFGVSATAYGFDLSVDASYQLGGWIFDSGYQQLMHTISGQGSSGYFTGYNWHTDILDAWTPENANSDIPRLCATDLYANATSDRFLTRASYLSLNNVTLGYTLPKSLTRKAQIEKVRFMIAAENVALLSARRGLDPRQSYTSSSAARYTPIRTVSGGVSLTF